MRPETRSGGCELCRINMSTAQAVWGHACVVATCSLSGRLLWNRQRSRRTPLCCLLVSYMPASYPGCCRGERRVHAAFVNILTASKPGATPFLAYKALTSEMAPRRAVALLLSTACASALVAPQPRLTRVAPLQSEPGPQPPAPEPEKPRPEPRPVIMPTVTGSNGEQIDVVSRLLKDRILLLGSRAVP